MTHSSIEVYNLQRLFTCIVSSWKDIISNPMEQKKHQPVPDRASEICDSWGLVWPTLGSGPMDLGLVCVSSPAIHPALALPETTDQSLARSGQADFAVIMSERCQWQSITFWIFLYVVSICFCKHDWAPNGFAVIREWPIEWLLFHPIDAVLFVQSETGMQKHAHFTPAWFLLSIAAEKYKPFSLGSKLLGKGYMQQVENHVNFQQMVIQKR